MNLKSQVQSQYSHALSHKGKAIGSALGIVAGVSYGLAGKQTNWAVAGMALAGAVGGAILGGMFDKAPTVVVPVDSNGDAKTPVVSDTAAMDMGNDTAGEDGASNASGNAIAGRVCGQEITQNELNTDFGGSLNAWKGCVCYGKGCAAGYSQTIRKVRRARR